MDIVLLCVIAALLIVMIICLKIYMSKVEKKEENRPRPQQNRVRNAAAPRRAQLARNRGARLRANVAASEHQESDDDDPEDEKPDIELPEGKIGAKKRAKLEAKAEKKAAREAEEQIRAERKKKMELAEEERKKLEEKEKADDKQREEEERRAKEEQEKKEYEEYLKMKEAFAVEEEGYEEGEEDNKNLLQEFVSFIKSNKVVVIEDLASQFKMKTQAVIDRLKDLQSDDILTGVIDDRGKFIYVSPEEMDAVAKFIRQQGRVSIAELAENSNKLINLMPATVTT